MNRSWKLSPLKIQAVLPLVLLVVLANPGHALQTGEQRDTTSVLGRLTGTIVDAESGEPLEGASVSIEPAPHGLLASLETGAAGLLTANRITHSDATGRYVFDDLGPGVYRLRVERMGYRGATVDVEYRGARESTVSVGLEVEPIRLEPIEVEGRSVLPMGVVSGSAAAEGDARTDVERVTQARFLQSDVRSLTRAELGEAITLGETDLFRALQRLPGVHGSDDWSANLLTRGARWDLTRFYYDGLPLFNPLHLGGVFSGVSPNAVGTVVFHPGVRPVDMGDASAGVVEMYSRPASGAEPTFLGELSAVSSRATWEGPYDEGRSGIAFSFRRTYVDWLTTTIVQSNQDDPDPPDVDRIPYGFQDFSFRWDQRIRNDYNLEYSRFSETDEVRGDIPDALHGNRGDWGNRISRLTLEVRKRGYRARITKGSSTYDASLRTAEPDPDIADRYTAPTAPPAWSRISTELLAATIEPLATVGGLPPWRAGLDRRTTNVGYWGPAAVPFPGGATLGSAGHGTKVERTSLWVERRLSQTPHLSFLAGLRGDWPGRGSQGQDGLTVSPRLTAAYQLKPEIRLTAGVGRHYQYEQAVAATGFSLGPRIEPTHIWVQSWGPIPYLRSDIVSLGGELWLGRGFLASGTAYVRASSGQLVYSPIRREVRASPVLAGECLGDGWQTATERAEGLDLSVRRIFGSITGSVAYSLSRSSLTAQGVTFASPGDRRHALDATLMARPLRWLKVGAAFSAVSGLPFTRFVPAAGIEPETLPTEGDVVGVAGPPYANRTPSLASLDLLLQYEGTVFGGKLGGYIQVKNVRDRTNPSSYLGSEWRCPGGGDPSGCPGGEILVDRFEDGIMVLPLIGFWIRF